MIVSPPLQAERLHWLCFDELKRPRPSCKNSAAVALQAGFHYPLIGADPASGVCEVLQGNISAGIHDIEAAIVRRNNEGYRAAADWYGGFLCEVYLEIIAPNEKLADTDATENFPVILRVWFTGSSRIRALTRRSWKIHFSIAPGNTLAARK